MSFTNIHGQRKRVGEKKEKRREEQREGLKKEGMRRRKEKRTNETELKSARIRRGTDEKSQHKHNQLLTLCCVVLFGV